MAENPYRWIKMHAEPKRKPDPVKPEPAKAEPARARPQAEPVIAERPRPRAPEAVAEVVAPVPPPSEVPAPAAAPAVAVAVATPAAAAASTAVSAETAAATAPPDDGNDGELVPISTPPPVFPRDLRGTVTTGRVNVAFTVQPDGTVGETTAESSTNRRLSKAALDAVKQWKFEPMTSAVTYKVEFDFKE